MINHVIKSLASDCDLQVVHVREVRGGQLARPVDLSEEDFLRRAVGGSPRFDLSLEGAELNVGKPTGEATLEISEEGLGLQPGIELQ